MSTKVKLHKIWEYLVKVAIHDPKMIKIRPKTMDCVLIRYA
jgi:hypothetical protein